MAAQGCHHVDNCTLLTATTITATHSSALNLLAMVNLRNGRMSATRNAKAVESAIQGLARHAEFRCGLRQNAATA